MSTTLPKRILMFYVDGFRSMTVGRKLWLIILIKLFILFFVFRLFFFPNLLQRDFSSDEERADAVRSRLTSPAKPSHEKLLTISIWKI